MKEDELSQSFEGLFSDVSLPPAEAAEGTQTPQPRPDKGSVAEEGTPSSVGHAPGLEAQPPATRDVESGTGGVQAWRQVYTELLFRASLAIGILAALIASYLAFRSQDIWAIPVYVGAGALLVLITLWSRLQTTLRIGGLLLVVYAMGLVDLLRVGKGGELRPLLLVVPFLATLYLGRRGGIVSLIVIALTMVGFGWAFTAGFLPVPMDMEASSARPLSWLTSAGVLLVLGSLVAYTLDYVVQRLVEALIRNRLLTRDLEEHRSRLLEHTGPMERRAHLLKISAEVGQAVTSILDADHLLRESVELIRDRFGWHAVALYLLEKDGEQLRLAAAAGEAGAHVPAEGVQLRVAETSLVGWCAKHRRPRVASDVADDGGYRPFPLLPRTAAQAGIPLLVGNRLLGVLDVECNETGAFDELAVEVLEGLAKQVASAINNASRVQQEAALLEATNPAYRATRRLAEAVSVDEVLDVVIKSVSETEAEGCILGLYDALGSSGAQGGSLTRTWHRRGPSPFAADTKLVSYAGIAARAGADARRPYESTGAYATRWLASNIDDRSRLPEARRPFFDRVAAVASYAGFNLGAVAHLPLVVGDRDIGILFIYRGVPGRFSQASLHLYQTLSDRAARAVERARRYQESQRSLQELQALNDIANAVSGSLNMEEVLEQTLKQTLASTGYEIGLISLVDPATDRSHLAAEQGLPAPLRQRLIEGGMDGTLCDHVYRQGAVLTVPDFADEAPTDVDGLLRMGLRSYLGIPLESRETIVGTICVFSHRPYSSDPAMIKLVEGVGRQVGVAIQNARLFAQARQRADRERLVSEVAAGMRGTLDLETVLKTAVYGIRQAMDLPAVTVRLGESDGEGMQ